MTFYIKNLIIFILTSLFVTLLLFQSMEIVYAHVNTTKVQELIDVKKNIRIQFGYLPEKPIIDTFTELQFSLQDLQSGKHIKDYEARVVVTMTNGQRLFKFENMTISDGDFSVKYIFPDDGTHQVLLRVNTNNSIILASFSVFVPHQPGPSILNPFPKTVQGEYTNDQIISMILAILLPLVAIVLIVIMVKKNKKTPNVS